MSTTSPFTPPRKKPSIFWWIGGVFLLLVLVFVFQLFGPSPRIIISPQTTHITTPLRPDGLPDYEAHILQQLREGVTPQNNAAALLWPAIWPGELSPKHYAAVAAELGLDAIPSPENAAVPISKVISNWLQSQQPDSANAGSANAHDDSEFDSLFNQVTSRPWTSSQYPWLAEWVNDSQKPLDTMAEASRRPRCYFPSPTLLDNQSDPVVSFLLPGVQSARECGRSLVARAMWHLGEHRPSEAWQDLLAIHRIGRLVTQGPTLVEQLVGIAIDNIACHATVTLLHDRQLTPEQARHLLRDLVALPPFDNYANSIDHTERLFFIDAAMQLSRNTHAPEMLGMMTDETRAASLLQLVRLDWNFVLRRGNEFYDRYAAAVRLPRFESRWQAVQQVNQSVQTFNNRAGLHTLASSTLNLTYRSDVVAYYLLSQLTPAVDAALAAQDRANAMLDLTRLAAALAVYRAGKGRYPERLDDLVPGVLEKLPVDFYHDKPFFYKRIDTGYLLYTAGPNGQDDGGSNSIQQIYMGYHLKYLSQTEANAAANKISAGADDLSIRDPLPPLKPRPAEFNPNQTEAR